MKIRAGIASLIALLAITGCDRPGPPGDVTALLRAQGFRYLDEPSVSITPLCSIQVGSDRYDFFWYEWRQQNPVGARHAAFRLIQIRDGTTYEGHYGVLPPERPLCRSDQRQIIFGSSVVGVGKGGLPATLFADGQDYTRER